MKSLLDDRITIPTLPKLAVKILDAVKDEDSSLERLATVVSSDPALVAKVLKVANSSLYGVRTRVGSIKQAIAMLGLNALKNIALSFVIVESLQGAGERQFGFELYWKRALTAAVAANLTARCLKQAPDEAFVCGLLQDIGIIILYMARPDDYSRIFDERKITGLSIAALEKKLLGCDHQEIGAGVLERWGLPPSISEPIRYHHHDGQAPAQYQMQTRIVQLADCMAAVYHGPRNAQTLQVIKTMLQDSSGIGAETAQGLLDAVAQESSEMISFFDFPGEPMKPVSRLLQEANEELSKLNLTYEYLALQYQWEKEQAMELAQALKAANEKLRSMAFRDELTGIFNQRQFLASLDHEFGRALRYQRPLALVLLDIDHFKQINDSFGHRCGDTLLRILSAALENVMRRTDLLARYGGDEFAIICPETNLQAAAVMAEQIRTMVEQLLIPLRKKPVRVTVSAGVAEYAPGCEAKAAREIFDAADRALYRSKMHGRNRVSVHA